MGVTLKRLTCLSLDDESSKFYDKKLLVGDSALFFIKSGLRFNGTIVKFGRTSLTIVYKDNSNREHKVLIPYDDIESFNKLYSGDESRKFQAK